MEVPWAHQRIELVFLRGRCRVVERGEKGLVGGLVAVSWLCGGGDYLLPGDYIVGGVGADLASRD